MYGHTMNDSHGEACGNCLDAEDILKTEIIPKETVPVEYREIDVYSPDGKAFTTARNIDKMPHIEKCDIYKDGEKKCEPFDVQKTKLKK